MFAFNISVDKSVLIIFMWFYVNPKYSSLLLYFIHPTLYSANMPGKHSIKATVFLRFNLISCITKITR